jgi:hypothetical protein
MPEPASTDPASAAYAAELLADLAALGVQLEHLLDRVIDVAAEDGLVWSDAREIEQLPARNAGGYRDATARVGAQQIRCALSGLRSSGREPGR